MWDMNARTPIKKARCSPQKCPRTAFPHKDKDPATGDQLKCEPTLFVLRTGWAPSIPAVIAMTPGQPE